MGKRIKQYIYIGIALGVLYFFLSNHLVFYGKDLTLLKKGKLSFNQTFISIKPTYFTGPEDILAIDVLRWDGIGDILVKKGLLTEEERWSLEDQYDAAVESGGETQ